MTEYLYRTRGIKEYLRVTSDDIQSYDYMDKVYLAMASKGNERYNAKIVNGYIRTRLRKKWRFCWFLFKNNDILTSLYRYGFYEGMKYQQEKGDNQDEQQ